MVGQGTGPAASTADIAATPLEAIDPSLPDRFADDSIWPMFRRLRDEAPVHYCAASRFGPYWSLTRYHDILEVETRPEDFSSARGISIGDVDSAFPLPMFIASDPPQHGPQRKVVSPIVAPGNLARLEPLIRQRAGRILEDLPIGETFDWVDRVSIELTIQMLATLFDFPFEERRRLVHWSAVAVGGLRDESARQEMRDCAAVFQGLWAERAAAPPRPDLISMLAHGEATRDMSPEALLGNLILLIVGGNDTTRNSLSGGLLALDTFPDEFEKLRADPGLVATLVPEIIRWQSPVAHMRRTLTRDLEFRGKALKAGEKVVLWYPSANRDERAIEAPDAFIIDRPNPRRHMAFGFGIHRCVGNRLAEMQLRIVWEEILKRFTRIELAGEPVLARTCLVREIRRLPVRIEGRR